MTYLIIQAMDLLKVKTFLWTLLLGLLMPLPSIARPFPCSESGWCRVSVGGDGSVIEVKLLSKQGGQLRSAYVNTVGFPHAFDCSGLNGKRFRFPGSALFREALPGTTMEQVYDYVCED